MLHNCIAKGNSYADAQPLPNGLPQEDRHFSLSLLHHAGAALSGCCKVLPVEFNSCGLCCPNDV